MPKKFYIVKKVLLEALDIHEFDPFIHLFLQEKVFFENSVMKLSFSSIMNAFKAIVDGVKH